MKKTIVLALSGLGLLLGTSIASAQMQTGYFSGLSNFNSEKMSPSGYSTYNVGQMIHSMYWTEYDHGGTISDEPYSGPPEYFWPNQNNWWDPRLRHVTTSTRGEFTFNVT